MCRKPATIFCIFLCILALLAFVSCGDDDGGGGGGGDIINSPVWDDITNPTAPQPPAYLEATSSWSSRIDLSWMASPDDGGEMQYKVYRDRTEVATVTGTSFSDTGLNLETEYCYILSAVNSYAMESAYTEEVCASTTYFTRVFSGGSGWDIKVTPDGGFVIAGGDGNDVYLIKTDQDGNDLWSKTYGGSSSDSGYSMANTSDGGFAIAGYTSSYGAGRDDVYLIKTDQDGNELWSKTFGGSNYDFGRSIIETSDGGLVIAGYTLPPGDDYYDAYLIKTDQYGNELWSNTYGVASNGETAYSVVETSDGGLAFAGNANSTGYLVKTDQDGNKLWAKAYGGSDGNKCYSISETPDGGFALACVIGRYPFSKASLIKTDQDGNELWRRTGNNDYMSNGMDVISTEGGLVLAGSSGDDVYLLKADLDGNMLWSKTYEGGESECAYSVTETPDGGLAVTGVSGNIFLMKTDSEGNMQ